MEDSMATRLGTIHVLVFVAAFGFLAGFTGGEREALALDRAGRPPVAATRLQPGGQYTLRGEVRVLAVSPWNPAGKDRLGTRIEARLEIGADGNPDVVLTHAWSGQSCRFDVKKVGRTMFSFVPQAPCRFKALSTTGSLQITNGFVDGDANVLRFRGTMEVQWLNYRGTLFVKVEGPRSR
jgi:hypothetical protein